MWVRIICVMGITPAYAGNTVMFPKPSIFASDHPRLRGEHFPVLVKYGTKVGSPPPTRGTPSVTLDPVQYNRITPAYAGNTYAE